MYRSYKKLDEIHCSNFQLEIRRTKHDLIIKLITRMEMNLLSLINPSLEVVYCSTTLSNHDTIRLKIFVSQLHPNYEMSFVSYPHLILLISGEVIHI